MPMAIIESFWPDVTNYVPAFVLVAINLVVIFAVARILIVVVRHSILTLTRLRSKNVDQAKQKRMEKMCIRDRFESALIWAAS